MDLYEIMTGMRKMVPTPLRRKVQGSAILSGMIRWFTKLLLGATGNVRVVRKGPAEGIRLIISEHLTEIYVRGKI